MDAGGSGYTAPTVTFLGGGATGTPVSVGNPLVPRAFATDYATPPGTLGPVFVVLPNTMPASGVVQGIQYFNQATTGGSPTPSVGNLFHAYVLQPTGLAGEYTVAWDSGELIVPATADPVGVVETIPVNIPVLMGDAIAFYGEGIPVDVGGGTDILSTPANTLPTVGSTITVAVGDPAFPIYSTDRTYSFAALFLDASPVPPTTEATATAYGGVYTVTLSNGGFGYSNPTVDFDLPDAPDGVQPSSHTLFDPLTGAITAVVVDYPGSGYSSAPNVVIRDGTIFDPINHDPGTFTAATASATLFISKVTVDTFGAGYASAPQVFINDPTGTGFMATATVSAGAVTGITLTAPGSGYITTGGIKKFQDGLPMLCIPTANFNECTDPVTGVANNLGYLYAVVG